VGRLSFLPLYALALFGHSQIFGTTFETIALWSPGGAATSLLSGAMHPAPWNGETWWALLVSLLYASVFAGVGIRWFQWSTR
jgi:ABC-2 type transport system permease protein